MYDLCGSCATFCNLCGGDGLHGRVYIMYVCMHNAQYKSLLRGHPYRVFIKIPGTLDGNFMKYHIGCLLEVSFRGFPIECHEASYGLSYSGLPGELPCGGLFNFCYLRSPKGNQISATKSKKKNKNKTNFASVEKVDNVCIYVRYP